MSIRIEVEKAKEQRQIPAADLPEGAWAVVHENGFPHVVRRLGCNLVGVTTGETWPIVPGESLWVEALAPGTHFVLGADGIVPERKAPMDDTILASKMRDGQTGLVVGPSSSPEWCGRIVRKCAGEFREVNGLSLLPVSGPTAQSLQVRLLAPGTSLFVTENGMALAKPEGDDTIPASQLRDGQVAEAVDWFDHRHGHVIQRFGDCLVAVGEERSHGWISFPPDLDYRVRPLPNGTRLIVEDNQ